MEKNEKRTIRIDAGQSLDSAGLEAWFSELAGQRLCVGKTGYYLLQIFKGKS